MALKQGRKQEIENTVRGVFGLCKEQGLDPNVWVIKAIKEMAKKKGLQMSKEEIAYADSYLQILMSASQSQAEVDAEIIDDNAAGQAGTAARTAGATVSVTPEDIEEEVPQENIFKLNLGDIGLGKGTLEVNLTKLFKNLADIPTEEYEEIGRKAGEKVVNHFVKPAAASGMNLLGDILTGKRPVNRCTSNNGDDDIPLNIQKIISLFK